MTVWRDRIGKKKKKNKEDSRVIGKLLMSYQNQNMWDRFYTRVSIRFKVKKNKERKMSEEERQQVVYDFEEGLEENNGCTSGDQKKKSKLCYGLVLLVILVAIATITTGIVLLKPSNRHSKGNNTKSVGSEKSDTLCSRHPTDGQIGSLEEYCQPSQEAQRIGLKKFLKKCEDFYFQMFRHEELMQHTNSPQHIKNSIAKRLVVVVKCLWKNFFLDCQ